MMTDKEARQALYARKHAHSRRRMRDDEDDYAPRRKAVDRRQQRRREAREWSRSMA